MRVNQNLAYANLVDESKQSALLDELTGLWLKDFWTTADLSTVVKVGSGYFQYKFTTPYNNINKELKYALFKMFSEGHCVPWDGNRTSFGHICSFISNQPEFESIIAEPLNSWLLKFRTYLINQGISPVRKGQKVEGTKHLSISLFEWVYIRLYQYYDPRDVFDRPEIDLNEVCTNGSKSNWAIVRLEKIKLPWLREATREYIKHRSTSAAPGTLLGHFDQLVRFSRFLDDEYSSIEPHNVTRDVLLKYLEYILMSVKKGLFNSSVACNAISYLRTFISISRCEEIFTLDRSAFYYNEEIPKREKPKPHFIPEDVVSQMMKHLDSLRFNWRLVLMLLLESGARVNEILSIPLDCLTKDADGDYWLKRFVWKQSKWHSVPVANEIVTLIKEWGQIVREKYGKFTSFLFPNKSGKKHLSLRAFTKAVNEWISKNNIVDKDGNLWRFRSHDCRHTIATNMIDQGLAHHFVCDFLGHDSVEMTRVYAAVNEAIVQGVTKKTHDKRREKTGENEMTDFMLKEISLAKTVRKNMIAQSLPNGRCNIPVHMGSCISGGACLECENFVSSPEFLPVFKNQLKEELGALEFAQENGFKLQIKSSQKNISLIKGNIAKLKSKKHSK